jgi:23S rRNA pseudouridine1911/1915/1917 synthase
LIDSLKTQLQIPDEFRGQRFDTVLAELMPEHSRGRIQSWIKDGQILLNGQVVKTREKLLGGETVDLTLELKPDSRWEAEAIPLAIVYQDQHVLIINKPAGLVVHPAAGNPDGTMVNALLHHFPELACLPRAGIVHRLDKDTSGLMVVARSPEAHTSLVNQLQDRSMGRQYEAVVMGEVTGGGEIDFPIGRHPRNRLKMAVVTSGKPAFTEYAPLRHWPGLAHLRLKLRTGRTHQIRVHLSHIRLPIIGDTLYNANHRLPRGLDKATLDAIQSFGRQALHAKRLEMIHPATGETMAWEVELPDDMQKLIARFNAWQAGL